MKCEECGEEAQVTWIIDGMTRNLCLYCYSKLGQEHTKRRNEESWMELSKRK